MPAQTMVEAIAQLNAGGYTDQCRARKDGLCFLGAGVTYAAKDVAVEHVIRIEGDSVASDEVMVFGLASPDGTAKATYCVAHGPDVDPLDAEMLRALPLDGGTSRTADDAPTTQH